MRIASLDRCRQSGEEKKRRKREAERRTRGLFVWGEKEKDQEKKKDWRDLLGRD